MEETIITFLARILSDAFQHLNGGIENLLPISRAIKDAALTKPLAAVHHPSLDTPVQKIIYYGHT